MTASILGAVGIAVNVIIYQQKSGKKLLAFKLVSDVMWALHYLLLNAYSACAIAAIGIFREGVLFYNQGKARSRNKLWLTLFLVLSSVSAAVTWKGIFSVLPAFASILSVFSFWRGNPKLTRILAFPISASMLAYDVFWLSYMGIASEIFTLISAAVGVIRNRKKS